MRAQILLNRVGMRPGGIGGRERVEELHEFLGRAGGETIVRVGHDVGVNMFAEMKPDRAAAWAGHLGIGVLDAGNSGKVGQSHGNRGLALRVRSTRERSRVGRGLEDSREHDSLGVGGPETGMLAAVNIVESLQQTAAER